MSKGRWIITGASSGIGLALSKAALAAGYEVLGVSRRDVPELEGETGWEYFCADLSKADQVEQVPLKGAKNGPTVLVNNAGVISPIGPAHDYVWDAVSEHFSINVTAPMRLSARFLNEVAGERQVYFTGSGAASYPIEGWAAYCASKAAVHQYAEVLAKEHPEVRIHAFRPGKVDTPMQGEIRSVSGHGFPSQHLFVEAHVQGDLVAPEAVARKLIETAEAAERPETIFSLNA